MISVLLVDDQELLRLGFRMILEAEPDLQVVGEAADGARGVHLAAALCPDVILMDIRMPGVDGIQATAEIVSAGGPSKVLILTTFDLDQYVFSGLRAGASGFLLKDAPPAELLTAIRIVAAGDAVLAPSTTRRLIDQFMPLMPDSSRSNRRIEIINRLTEREREVFVLLAAAKSNFEIAAGLHLSESTIKVHVGHILAKLSLRDRIQAVVLAYESGFVIPDGHRHRPGTVR